MTLGPFRILPAAKQQGSQQSEYKNVSLAPYGVYILYNFKTNKNY